jgi:hypothetical protein
MKTMISSEQDSDNEALFSAAHLRPGPTNALDVLRQWHIETRRVCTSRRAVRGPGFDPEDGQGSAHEICRLLAVQCQAKAEVFFPALRGEAELADMTRQADVENQALWAMATRLGKKTAEDADFKDGVLVLCDNFAVHARKLEARLFPGVTRTSVNLEQLGAALIERHLLINEDDDPVGGMPPPGHTRVGIASREMARKSSFSFRIGG